MTTAQIRKAFVTYFHEYHHEIIPSSSLIPSNDPTLLFTNSGMVQFKDVFLGHEQRPYKRATTVQCCLRVSGKHNDLENVGFTARHHTFFEMLGNFSFGDYFKREAIKFAWTFLTEVLHLPANKLWVTVYEKDDEAADIWIKEMGIDPQRFSRCGMNSNFWAMGDTGPCGPCSEIFYDHGEHIAGGPPGSPDEDGDRYIEIWNLVFMQFNRDAAGTLTPLAKPSIDTGMGLERITAIMQGVHNNYDIDLFKYLIKAAATLANCHDLTNPLLRVIADHIRACAFLIVDGVIPSNEGRGYVLRRIARRAIRHGNKLGIKEPFFHKLVKPLVEIMGEAYPKIITARPMIEKVLLKEEQQFAKTLEHGLKILEQHIATMSEKVIAGELAFKLYDTYGFPLDLTAVIAKEHGLTVDQVGFDAEMERQKLLSQASSQFNTAANFPPLDSDIPSTNFTGYKKLVDKGKVLVLIGIETDRDKPEQNIVKKLSVGQTGIVILNKTPFYAESGGQIGDKGTLTFSKGGVFNVTNVIKVGGHYFHLGVVGIGTLSINNLVTATVNVAERSSTMVHHSAAHLLQAALRQIIGAHVAQKGSLVTPERLRFDFSHYQALTPDQVREVERLVNEYIRVNCDIKTNEMSLEEAKQTKAIALFGEKYGDTVRVVSMGDLSVELCGGTHAKKTGDLGAFKIISEIGIAAGVRRIEAKVGEEAIKYIQTMNENLTEICNLLKVDEANCSEKLVQNLQHQNELEKLVNKHKLELLKHQSNELLLNAKEIKGIKLVVKEVADIDRNGLRELLDLVKSKAPQVIAVLAAINDNKIDLIVGVSKSISNQFSANNLLSFLATKIDGKGGGRADMAQGGGTNLAALTDALNAVSGWVEKQ